MEKYRRSKPWNDLGLRIAWILSTFDLPSTRNGKVSMIENVERKIFFLKPWSTNSNQLIELESRIEEITWWIRFFRSVINNDIDTVVSIDDQELKISFT